ncbi:MarR family winged helix-turn-helix transcriptional regulator [Streptodolium elevatio]
MSRADGDGDDDGHGAGGSTGGGTGRNADAVEQFYRAFGEASRRIAYSRIEQRIADAHELDLLAFRLMLHVREEDRRVGELAQRVVAHASHTSKALTVLERRGWITRHATPGDRRVVEVRTTPAGLTASRAMRAELRAALAERVADWSEGDLATATALMRRLSDAF